MSTEEIRKRTRILGQGQSKSGCFTCKYGLLYGVLRSRLIRFPTCRARRVKCDEARPGCARCKASKRECEGYPDKLLDDKPISQSSRRDLILHSNQAPKLSLSNISDGLPHQPEQARFAHLGCQILAQARCRGLGSGTLIWSQLLPQLSHGIRSVNAAVAALGAIYEANLLPNSASLESRRGAAVQYGIAVRDLRQDLSSQLYGPVPTAVSCAVLCISELVQHREINALMHLQGAMKILRSRHRHLIQEVPSEPLVQDACDASTPIFEDNLSLMFMTLDIQKASYAVGEAPDLPPCSPQSLTKHWSSVQNIGDAEFQLVRLIHSSYHFTAHATQFKYCEQAQSLTLEQGRQIALLSRWLDAFNQTFFSIKGDWRNEQSPDTQYHALVLRAQCVSTIVYLSTVLMPNETSYDCHGPSFERIVQDAGTVLAHDSKSNTELQQFHPSPGLIQPLLLTATKYRHGSWRRKAIQLLRQSGREGPFNGKIFAGLANCVMQLEESHCQPSVPGGVLPEHIVERDRVHGCGVDFTSKDCDSMDAVPVRLTRCYDLEQMLSGSETWDHKSNWETLDYDIDFCRRLA